MRHDDPPDEVQRWLPSAGDEPLDELYRDLHISEGTHERPHVLLGMVTSIDGAASVEGVSGGLGGDADGVAYRRLRDAVDAILVGAGTVRAERYRPPAASADRISRRRGRGLADLPTIAIVSASLDLPLDLPVFGDRARRPVVITGASAPEDRRIALAEVADVLVAGEDRVDPRAALAGLGERGWTRVLCEGGPTLNAQLVADGLADELFVTLAPVLVGQTAHRIIEGDLGREVRLTLTELRHHRGELLARYRIG